LRAVRSDKLAHAYLFLGPPGSGKLPLALELARILNCDLKAAEASIYGCSCRSCQKITRVASTGHPNLSLVFPLPKPSKKKDEDEEEQADGENLDARMEAMHEVLEAIEKDPYVKHTFHGTGRLLVGQIRELRRSFSLTGDTPGVRTAIIFPADTMNDESANALLKLLEEPPDRTLLILIADSARNLLPTIVSRCQQVRFSPLSMREIEQGLMSRKIPRKAAMNACRIAEGDLSAALQLCDEKVGEEMTECLDFLRAAASGNVVKTSEWIERWSKGEERKSLVKDKLRLMNLWILDALTIQAFGAAGTSKLRVLSGGDAVAKIAARYDADRLREVIQRIEETSLSLESNALPALTLATLAIRINRALN